MSLSEELLPEFDEEMAVTRRLLERVPSEKGEWKPHPKSFSLAHLAQLVARMPGWIPGTLLQDKLDIKSGSEYSVERTETLLKEFDSNVTSARKAIEATNDEAFDQDWSLMMGDQVIFTAKRRRVIRQHINHIVHHRGQLTVYLRETDVPIPSIYGPTADEPWGQK
ncbi:MAG: damage-inducible protein DinB [bacterium]|nr:damage-inducible protein DinB [Candidatus Kapabacteria bacterium]